MVHSGAGLVQRHLLVGGDLLAAEALADGDEVGRQLARGLGEARGGAWGGGEAIRRVDSEELGDQTAGLWNPCVSDNGRCVCQMCVNGHGVPP